MAKTIRLATYRIPEAVITNRRERCHRRPNPGRFILESNTGSLISYQLDIHTLLIRLDWWCTLRLKPLIGRCADQIEARARPREHSARWIQRRSLVRSSGR